MGEFERYKKGMRGLEKIPGLGSMGVMYLSPRVVVNALKGGDLPCFWGTSREFTHRKQVSHIQGRMRVEWR